MSAGCFSSRPYSDPLAACVTGRTLVDRSTVSRVVARPGHGPSMTARNTIIPEMDRFTRETCRTRPDLVQISVTVGLAGDVRRNPGWTDPAARAGSAGLGIGRRR